MECQGAKVKVSKYSENWVCRSKGGNMEIFISNPFSSIRELNFPNLNGVLGFWMVGIGCKIG